MTDPVYYTGSDTREAQPDPDYCPWCKRHYSEPCEDGCGCESCKSALIQQTLREIDVIAGEKGE